MSKMEILYEGYTLEIDDSETVLECLERNGHRLASSCRSGICQSCLMQGEPGRIPAIAQRDLSPSQQAQGYFLACVCRPAEPLSVARIDPARLQVAAEIADVSAITNHVYQLALKPAVPTPYYAGQFFNLILPDGTRRSYSAATPPCDEGTIRFHIGILPGGAFSNWVSTEARRGQAVLRQGPLGKCCYVPGNTTHTPLLLAGTGTGLAPLYGILEAALADGHPGPIHLFHGALNAAGLYLHEQLCELAERNPKLHYHPCALHDNADRDDIHLGDMQDHILLSLPKLTGYQVYLCGHPDFVKAMQRKTFLAGASLRDIHADAFLPSLATVQASSG